MGFNDKIADERSGRGKAAATEPRATEKQVKLLARFGFADAAGWSRREASARLTQLEKRGWHWRTCPTENQVATLERHGVRGAGEWTYEQAREALAVLEATNWKAPAERIVEAAGLSA